MKTESTYFKVSDSIGTVSAIFLIPKEPSAVFVFGHGAGAGMQHPFMERLAATLGEGQVATLRYNFPYMERGSKRPDPPAIAERAVLGAIALAGDRFPHLPIFAGGKSFGGRMTSQALANGGSPNVRGLIFVGFPLHAAAKPGTNRSDHLKLLKIPMLFLQGTRDALATLDLIEQVCDTLPSATLAKFEGADHSFKAGKKDLIPDIGATAIQWITAHR